MEQRRLLVIDDEPDFTEYVRRVATDMGFDVRDTTRPDEFKQLFQDFGPALIVLDVVMPDVDGIELVHWLAEQKCDARIIVVTGYNPNYAEMAGALGEARGLSIEILSKPVRLSVLREKLRES